jgi:hypothetical protein
LGSEIAADSLRQEPHGLLRREEYRAWDRRHGTVIFALEIVGRELVDLFAEDWPLIGLLRRLDLLLDLVPVDEGWLGSSPFDCARTLNPRTAEHLEANQSLDVGGCEVQEEEVLAELPDLQGRDGEHRPSRLLRLRVSCTRTL